MRIIQLEIQNLASLDRQGGEVINFEEGALGESNIFSIVGPTGSGKSTLLDAICLALYGRAPRYPRKPGEHKQGIVIYGEMEEGEKNRPAPTDAVNILTRGKKVGYSKLTFRTNNGNIYRAEWHVRFKSKEYDKPNTYLYILTQENGQPKEEAANWDDLPTIIGLDYEQFLRTVLIAQGTFANFLTAKEDERYELLEKLIGCKELYINIANKIKDQKDIAVKAYDKIDANFNAFKNDIISEEKLPELEKRINELEAEDKNVREELTKITESLGWYTAEKQYQENLEKYEIALKQAQQNLESIKEEIERLSLHDATLPAVGLYQNIQQVKKSIDKQEQQLKELDKKILEKKNAIEEENNSLNTLKAKADSAAKELETQKPHINKARTIKGELANANTFLEEKKEIKRVAEEALKKARKDIVDNEAAIRQAKQALSNATADYEKLKRIINEESIKKAKAVEQATLVFKAEKEKAKGIDASKLQEADRIANQKKSDIKEAIRIRQSIKKSTEEIERNNKEIVRLTNRNKAIDEEITGLNSESLQKEIETLQKSYTLMTSENWTQHRTDLEDGKPCPLCGATHHPYKSNEAYIPVVTEMERLINEKKKTLDEQNEKSKQLSEEKSRNDGSILGMNKSIDGLTNDLIKEQGNWTGIHAKYPDWPEEAELLKTMQSEIDNDAEQTQKALKDFNVLSKKIEGLRQEKEAAEKAQNIYKEQSEKKLKEAEKQKTAANTTLLAESGKTENLKAQAEEKQQALTNAIEALTKANAEVASKTAAIKAEIGDKDPETFEEELIKAKGDADQAVEEQKKKISRIENEENGLKGQVKATESAKKAEVAKVAENEPKLTAWLEAYNAAPDHLQKLTVDDIDRISEWTDDWESIRRKKDNLAKAKTAAKATYKNEETNHNKHQEKRPVDDKVTLEARKAELEQRSNAELVGLKAQKQRHDDAKKQMGELFEKRQAAELQKTEWEKIAAAIGADGKTLRKIAQCYTLRFLIAHANVEIRKFNSRYELQQVKNSLGIRVIDHDRADDIRDTTSLSGGETFIVSLGLALGLSALSSRNISFENLFIDEGFGTLDHDTLETVIDSLAMLQSSQGKKVGVISHTDTMARITTQIRIIRNGSSGSSHIEIYP